MLSSSTESVNLPRLENHRSWTINQTRSCGDFGYRGLSEMSDPLSAVQNQGNALAVDCLGRVKASFLGWNDIPVFSFDFLPTRRMPNHLQFSLALNSIVGRCRRARYQQSALRSLLASALNCLEYLISHLPAFAWTFEVLLHQCRRVLCQTYDLDQIGFDGRSLCQRGAYY